MSTIKLQAIADADGQLWTRGAVLSDVGLMDGVRRTADGYLLCNARVARTGLQDYCGYEVGMPEKERVVLFRPESEVFSRDTMHSMANKPITLNHPNEMVTKDSWSKYAKGFSGNDVVRDGEYIRVPLMLTDAAAINAYERDEARELSVGYTTDISWIPGKTAQGEAYDGIQTGIRCNHHAQVPAARGGSNLRLGDNTELKNVDAVFPGLEGVLSDDSKSSQTDGKPVTHPTIRKRLMAHTNSFDGVTVEFADELSASNMNTAFSALKAKLKDAEKKAKDDEDDMDEKDKKNKADCDDAKAKIDAKDGEIAVLKKQLADAAVTPAMLDTMLRDREVVKDAARKVLDAKFPFDGKSVAEIKLAAVAAKLGDATVKDMNEAAVAGAFVALTAAAATAGTSRLADALGSHARSTVVVGDARSEGVRLRDEAHALMVDRMRFPKNYDADGRKIVA
jgi:hypothetical protein